MGSHKIQFIQTAGVLLVRTSWIMAVVFSLIVSSVLFTFSYETIIHWIVYNYSQPDKLTKFQDTLLTQERFILLRYTSLLVTTALVITCFCLWNKAPSIIIKATQCINTVNTIFKSIYSKTTQTERILSAVIFLFVVCCQLYFLTKMPLHVDERFTYLYFVNKGWMVSAAYYPGPNNHILFSLLCNIARLFFTQPILILRIPALLTGLAAFAALWVVTRYYFSAFVALSSIILLAFTPPVFAYGIQGRGYSLLLLWMIASIAIIIKITSRQKITYCSALGLITCCSFGFYTIPIFLYPFAGMGVYLFVFFLLKKDLPQLTRTIGIGIIITAFVFLLYLPVFIVNGWNAVSGNGWIAPLNWHLFLSGLPSSLNDNAAFLWNDLPFASWFTLVTSVAILLIIQAKTLPSIKRSWLHLYLVCLWIVIPIIILQRILLYSRVMIFIFPLQWSAVAIILEQYLSSVRYYIAGIAFGLIVYAAACLYNFQQLVTPEGKGIYNSLDNVSIWLYKHQADSVFVQYYEYGLCILFQYETNHHPIELDIGADRFSSKKIYNFVVVHKDHLFPASLPSASYQIVYKDADAIIYQYRRK